MSKQASQRESGRIRIGSSCSAPPPPRGKGPRRGKALRAALEQTREDVKSDRPRAAAAPFAVPAWLAQQAPPPAGKVVRQAGAMIAEREGGTGGGSSSITPTGGAAAAAAFADPAGSVQPEMSRAERGRSCSFWRKAPFLR